MKAHLIYHKDDDGMIAENSFEIVLNASQAEVAALLVARKRAWLLENDVNPEDVGFPFEFNPRTEYSLSDALQFYWTEADDTVVTAAYDSLMFYNEGWYVAEVSVTGGVNEGV